jgi:nijmegen breakage syndrome protein 1
MFVLLNEITNTPFYYFLQLNKTYKIGRKGDIKINKDQSISREHCEIILKNENLYKENNEDEYNEKNKEENKEKKTIIEIKDFSKYGTFVNEKKLEQNQIYQINENDLISFGVYSSKFR